MKVYYNEGEVDQFFHKYKYDTDNRIEEVYTSADGKIWDKDAGYDYYEHGPLARTEIGEDKIQGLDYIYTINGWLKAVNTPDLSISDDPFNDGENGTSEFARDAFSMQLVYFRGDFTHISSPWIQANSANLKPELNQQLFNGNIASWTTNTVTTSGEYAGLTGYTYKYDELNRIRTADFNYYNGSWNTTSDYGSSYTYDANGNLLTLNRNGNSTSGVDMDSLSYQYDGGTNRLDHVNDPIGPSSYDDLDDQTSGNYTYDSIGNLISDAAEGIDSIKWTVYGKADKIYRGDTLYLDFVYDATGNRIGKIQYPEEWLMRTETWYSRDASGNVMAVYNVSYDSIGSDMVQYTFINERPIYGSSRVGQYVTADTVKTVIFSSDTTENSVSLTDTGVYSRMLDKRRYELSDHLGNVRMVLSDIKLSTLNAGVPEDFYPDTLSWNNYYAFGMLQPQRNGNPGDYRYGFNGKEFDPEVSGNGNSYDYGFRIYNPRLGKFLSEDPLTNAYPWYTPYQFAGNKPIWAIDLDGLEEYYYLLSFDKGFSEVKYKYTLPNHETNDEGVHYIVMFNAVRTQVANGPATSEYPRLEAPKRTTLFIEATSKSEAENFNAQTFEPYWKGWRAGLKNFDNYVSAKTHNAIYFTYNDPDFETIKPIDKYRNILEGRLSKIEEHIIQTKENIEFAEKKVDFVKSSGLPTDSGPIDNDESWIEILKRSKEALRKLKEAQKVTREKLKRIENRPKKGGKID